MTFAFLDTGYIIALEAADDQHHQDALKYWQSLFSSLTRLVTTSYVLDEVVTFFNGRNQHAKAIEVGNRVMGSPSVQFVHVDEALFHEGWRYFEQHEDKTYSLTDRISFVLMDRLGIRNALAFDRHFFLAGFQKLP
ncbi:MAG: type II toxin-antitoxin system VapC family toxin [candidate division KSB1 bacterium]|nr:type II toxin-antitoxin system VapC family toxin [candidate division KSB1 bacterium]MDZ7301257.1 type II toxin-antitoxin system VapC family toxin [candidate division KSB1 bacterium]MDZ7310519.1 type II toxin-antitoxin system VapC family toxin [candidate division KSB1 bacterium]